VLQNWRENATKKTINIKLFVVFKLSKLQKNIIFARMIEARKIQFKKKGINLP
jgi:hypothetical protein